MNRIRQSTLVDRVKKVTLVEYPVYDHDLILNSYRAHIKNYKRKNPKATLPDVWKNFRNFTTWFFMSNYPFLRDNKGNIFMPYDPKHPYELCPSNPSSLICDWQRSIESLEPKLRGAKNFYLHVEEYSTGEMCKLRYLDDFNLRLFKRKLIGEYFPQFFELELNSDLSKLKTVTDIYKEVINDR